MFNIDYNYNTDSYEIIGNDRKRYYLNNEASIYQLLRYLNMNDKSEVVVNYNSLKEELSRCKNLVFKQKMRIGSLEKKLNVYEDKLNGRFPLSAEPIKSPYRLDLREYFKIPSNYTDKYWYEGQIIDALKYYMSDEVELYDYERVGEYQGEYFSSFSINNYFFIWRGDFGSCDACDIIAGENIEEGYDTLLSTLTEGNTLQFYSKTHALNYITALRNSDRYNYWQNFPLKLLEE